MNYELYRRVKFAKWVLLFLGVVSVFSCDLYRRHTLKQDVLRESRRSMKLVWETVSKLVEVSGKRSLPIQEQSAWASLDIYLVDPVTEEFITAPRHEPWRTNVRVLLADVDESADHSFVRCQTPSFKLAAGGEYGARLFPNYREMDVISAFGLVDCAGTPAILLVEISMDEAYGAWLKWFMWADVVAIAFFNGLVGLLIYFVHFKLDRVLYEREHSSLSDALAVKDYVEDQLQKKRDIKL